MVALTDKQRRFVDEYIISLNATQAAIKAGYSPKTAEQMGYKLVQNSSVSEALQKKRLKLEKKTEITQERILQELANVALANATDYVTITDGGVQIVNTADIPPDKLAAIAGIKQTQTGIEIKTRDKLKALELLGKHLGMFNDTDKRQDDNITVVIEGVAEGWAK
jgi:phage terminase small subunit